MKRRVFVVPAFNATGTMVIRAVDVKVAAGHRKHFTGTGPHDSRPRRVRTRAAVLRHAMKD